MNEFTLTIQFPHEKFTVPLDYLLKAIGKEKYKAQSVALNVTRDDVTLTAMVYPGENEYVGLDVDAYSEKDDMLYYLGNFELPSPTYENSIAARLYAGNSQFETDSPVALVRHDVKNKTKTEENIRKYENSHDGPHKIVYVDTDLAQYRNWTGTNEDELPEHVEDK